LDIRNKISAPLKPQKRIRVLLVCSCLVLVACGCGRSRDPSGKYVSLIRLPGSGEEWSETVDFKPNGICY